MWVKCTSLNPARLGAVQYVNMAPSLSMYWDDAAGGTRLVMPEGTPDFIVKERPEELAEILNHPAGACPDVP